MISQIRSVKGVPIYNFFKQNSDSPTFRNKIKLLPQKAATTNTKSFINMVCFVDSRASQAE